MLPLVCEQPKRPSCFIGINSASALDWPPSTAASPTLHQLATTFSAQKQKALCNGRVCSYLHRTVDRYRENTVRLLL